MTISSNLFLYSIYLVILLFLSLMTNLTTASIFCSLIHFSHDDLSAFEEYIVEYNMYITLRHVYTTQLQYIVDQYDVKTLPELLGYLRLDRLLSADGILLDGILSAGTNIILGRKQWPTAIQTVPMAKDYNLQPVNGLQVVHPTKITRMSLMGRPVRIKTICQN